MGQKHTWNFYLTAGRTWGGPKISGATITAYSSKTGSTVLQTLTTDASGYTTYTLSGSSYITAPSSYYWRVSLGNTFGDYYNGKNIIGKGDTSGYYGTPGASLNTEGLAIMSSSFNTNNINATGTVNVYFFAAGNGITIDSSKFLTHFDVIALAPPSINFLPARPSTWLYNQCITGSELADYDTSGAFSNSQFHTNSDLVTRYEIMPWNKFYTSSQVSAFTLATTSLAFNYDYYGSSNSKMISGTCSQYCVPSVSINSTYFTCYMSSISISGNVYSFGIHFYPKESNYGTSIRMATATVKIIPNVTDGYVNPSFLPSQKEIILTQHYYQSGGSSGSTGGGAGGGGSQT